MREKNSLLFSVFETFESIFEARVSIYTLLIFTIDIDDQLKNKCRQIFIIANHSFDWRECEEIYWWLVENILNKKFTLIMFEKVNAKLSIMKRCNNHSSLKEKFYDYNLRKIYFIFFDLEFIDEERICLIMDILWSWIPNNYYWICLIVFLELFLKNKYLKVLRSGNSFCERDWGC